MRFGTAILALLLAGAPLCVSAADQRYSDAVCPAGTAAMADLAKLQTGDPPQKIYDAAHAASYAYDLCGKLKLSNGDIEPGAHYAFTREAQFGILAGRALVQLGRTEDARREFAQDAKLAQDVADWVHSNNGSNIGESAGSVSRYSRFHDAAVQVVAAARAELAKLTPATAAPAPTATP